jgi:hypothetical protein
MTASFEHRVGRNPDRKLVSRTSVSGDPVNVVDVTDARNGRDWSTNRAAIDDPVLLPGRKLLDDFTN